MLTSLAALTSILTAIGGLLLELWKGRGPSALQSQSEKVGALQVQLKDEEATNAINTKVAAADAALGGVLADPARLREYEARDPNNLDRR